MYAFYSQVKFYEIDSHLNDYCTIMIDHIGPHPLSAFQLDYILALAPKYEHNRALTFNITLI